MTGFAGERGVSAAMGEPIRRSRLPAAAWTWTVIPVAAVVGAALILGNAAGRPALAVAVGVVQAGFIAGWLTAFAGTLDAAVLTIVAVAVADVVLLRTRAASGGSIAGVIGLSVIGVLFHQLVRRDPRGVTGAVALTLSAIMLGAAPALLLPLRELPGGRGAGFVAVFAGAIALALVRLPAGPDVVRRLGALVVAVAAALAVGAAKGGLSTGHAAAMGASCAVVVLLVDRLLARIDAAGWSSTVVAAVVPLALACPVAYLVGRVIAPGVG